MVVSTLLIVLALILSIIELYGPENKSRNLKLFVLFLLIASASFLAYKEYQGSIEQVKNSQSGKFKTTTMVSQPWPNQNFDIEIGNSGTIFKRAAGTDGEVALFSWGGENNQSPFSFSVSQEKVFVNSDIFNSQNQLVARIVNNEWQINDRQIFDRNYSDNALEIIDETGDVVFQIEVLKERVRIQGKFYSPDGSRLIFLKNPIGSGALIQLIRKNDQQEELKIKKMFKYPSRDHFGEKE